MIDIQKIKKEYPKSYEYLKTFTSQTLKAFHTMASQDAPETAELLPNLDDSMIEAYTDSITPLTPRILYEFFDALGVRIGVSPQLDGDLFTFWNNIDKESKTAKTRVEAEETAFTEAFKVTEKKLNK